MDAITERLKLHGVIYERDGKWFAVLLEKYLMTFADRQVDLKQRIHEMILTHIVASLEAGTTPFEDLPKAPKRYWDLYDEAQEIPDEMEPPTGLYAASFPRLDLRASPLFAHT